MDSSGTSGSKLFPAIRMIFKKSDLGAREPLRAGQRRAEGKIAISDFTNDTFAEGMP